MDRGKEKGGAILYPVQDEETRSHDRGKKGDTGEKTLSAGNLSEGGSVDLKRKKKDRKTRGGRWA